MKEIKRREEGKLEEQEELQADEQTAKKGGKQSFKPEAGEENLTQKTELKVSALSLEELPFLKPESPFLKPKELSQKIKAPSSIRIFPKIPSFVLGSPQQAKLIVFSAKLELPVHSGILLKVPRVQIESEQRVNPLSLKREFRFPRIPQLLLRVPFLHKTSLQRVKPQTLERTWTEPFSQAKALVERWAENNQWAKVECCWYLRNTLNSWDFLDRNYGLGDLSRRYRIDGEDLKSQVEREAKDAGTNMAEVGKVAQSELKKSTHRLIQALKGAPENLRWTCYSWSLLRRHLTPIEAKDISFPASLASGLDEEKTLEELIKLGLGLRGYRDTKAYSYPTWKEHPAVSGVLEDLRQRPKDYGLQPPSLESVFSKLVNDEAFKRFVEFIGEEGIKKSEVSSFKRFISNMDQEFREGTFNDIAQHLLRCGALFVNYHEGRRRSGKRSSTLDEFEIGFTREATEALRRTQAVEKQTPKEASETKTGEALGGGRGVGTGIEDFYELFLEKRESGPAIRGVLEGGYPAMLVLSRKEGEEYGETIKALCSQIYREIHGGPLKHFHVVEEEKEVEKISATQRLIFTNLSNLTAPIKNRIRSFAGTREPGFLLFYLPEEKANFLYEKLKEELTDTPVGILHLGLKDLSPERKGSFLSLFWGYTKPDDLWFGELQRSGLFINEGATFDQIFIQGEYQFRSHLVGILSKDKGLYRRNTARSQENSLSCGNGNQESPEHYWIKAFLVYYFTNNSNLSGEEIESEIETEKPTKGHPIDVYIKRMNHAVEVETLFGQGTSPLSKVDETIRRCRDNLDIKKLWIILPNPTFLRHLRELAELQRTLCQTPQEIKLRTLDLSQDGLLSVDEVQSKFLI